MNQKSKLTQFIVIFTAFLFFGMALSAIAYSIVALDGVDSLTMSAYINGVVNTIANPSMENNFVTCHLFGFGLAFIGALLLLAPNKKKLHGDYRFAKHSDIKKAGLFNDDETGILLGQFNNEPLFFGGQEFVCLYAPTRSGKGVSAVLPNLLLFQHSIICLDIKKENFELTSNFRQQHGQQVFLFSPADEEYKTHCWNPLAYISNDPYHRLNDIDKICNHLIPTPPNTDPMWSASGRSLLKALILLVMDISKYPSTLGETLRQLRTEMPTGDYFKELLQEHADELDDECIRGLSEYVNTPSKTAEGIKKTVTSALNPWSNPLVDTATSKNDFDLTQIRKKPMTIYIGLSQSQLDYLSPVVKLFIQQLVDLNTQAGDTTPRYDKNNNLMTGNPEIKYQCLLLLDEFCALGKMDSLSKGVSFFAGYNLRFTPIFQSDAQLRNIYKADADNFLENHAVKILYKPNTRKAAEELSNSLGYTTFVKNSKSKQSGSMKENTSTSEEKRALLLPEEIMEMDETDQFIISNKCPYPIKSKKIRYFEDKRLYSRLCGAIEIPELQPKHYEVRGKAPTLLTEMFKSMDTPIQDEQLTDDQIDTLVDDFFDQINENFGEENTNKEHSTNYTTKQQSEHALVDGFFEQFDENITDDALQYTNFSDEIIVDRTHLENTSNKPSQKKEEHAPVTDTGLSSAINNILTSTTMD